MRMSLITSRTAPFPVLVVAAIVLGIASATCFTLPAPAARHPRARPSRNPALPQTVWPSASFLAWRSGEISTTS
jgi:hypothetical protein